MKSIDGPDACHCLAARRGARLLSRLYDRRLSPVGLNISQFALLSYLEKEPNLSTSSLASRMVMERTTLVRALKPLRAAGLIDAATQGGPDLRFNLTPKGARTLAAAVPLWEAAQKEYEADFGKERAVRLRRELMSLTASPDV